MAGGNFVKKEPKKVTAALAFGAKQPGLVSEKSLEETEAEAREKKNKNEKLLMNANNWDLAKGRTDLYIPNKLPFFDPQVTTDSSHALPTD